MKGRRLPFAFAFLLLAAPAGAQHAGDMLVGSTTAGGGALGIAYDFAPPVVVTESASGGGSTLYSGTDPGWDLLATPTGRLVPLPSGVPVTVVVTAIDAGASLKIGPTTLSAVGHSRLLGMTPSVHVHPIWQLVLPAGTTGSRAIAFRLVTTAAGWSDSPSHVVTLTNAPSTTTTSSSTTTTTTTSATTTTSTTLTPDLTELRSGKKLQLKDKAGDPAKRALLVHSTDAALGAGAVGGPDDPTLHGGSVRVASVVGGFDATYALPSTGWTRIEKRGVLTGYRYVDKARTSGPIKTGLLKAGKLLKLAGAGADLVHTLGHDPAQVVVVVRLGARRYCFRFGGSVKSTAGKQWTAMNAPAPEACAP
jgi:hypothetical protein